MSNEDRIRNSADVAQVCVRHVGNPCTAFSFHGPLLEAPASAWLFMEWKGHRKDGIPLPQVQESADPPKFVAQCLLSLALLAAQVT